MRIIHVLSSVMWSGVERYALDICRYFAERGHEVLAVTRDARAVDDVFRRHDINVTFAPLGGFLSYEAVKAMCEILNASPLPTAVHCHSTRDAFTALTARLLTGRNDIRVILTRHYAKRGGRSPFHKFTYCNVDHLIFVSRKAKEKFLSAGRIRKLYKSGQISASVIHNSLNIERGPVADEPSKGPVTAMYLGRLAPDKGIENLLEALELLKDIKLRLRIVGTGHPDYVDQLRRKAQALDVMNMIDWPRHKENTTEFIRMSHFGVLPSVAPEAFGLANIEFMAEGRPIICTDNGAQPEYISHRINGVLVPPDDTVVLANEMRRMATSSGLRKEIGLAARGWFERYLSWERFIDHLLPLYEMGS